jgi:large subunit ribosomal protein L10
MSKFVKELMVEESRKRFGSLTEFLVVTTIGIGGNDNNEMRGALLEKGIKVSIVKNSVMRKALAAFEKAEASNLFATGPCAIAYGGDSVVDIAKEIDIWAKKLGALEVKGAYIDGEVLDAGSASGLSKMLSRAELQGQVVVLAVSPGRRVAGAITGPVSYIAGCIKTIIEKAEEAEEKEAA